MRHDDLPDDDDSTRTTSMKKVEANRRNGAKSKGPRTAQGKLASRGNARKHGILATTLLLEGPEKEEFEGLHAQYIEAYRPVGFLEESLIERATLHQRKLGFVELSEAGHVRRQQAELELRRSLSDAGEFTSPGGDHVGDKTDQAARIAQRQLQRQHPHRW